MTILHYTFIAIEVVLIFNLIIGVHELGHFLAAKWRGLKIDRFAIWFGKPIWKKKVNGVEYALGWIPAGGYVALPQMATMEAIEGKNDEADASAPLPNVTALDKIIVAFAGPLFSFMLAFAFACLVWGVGKPSNEGDNSTQIGWVIPDGPAWQAGLRPGDIVKEVDDHPVKNFLPTGPLEDSIKWRIITSTGTNVHVKYVRDGKLADAYPIPTNVPTKWYERKSLRQIFVDAASDATILDVASNSPAAAAGLRSGDQVVALNGQKIYSSDAIDYAQMEMSNGVVKPLTLTVRRGNDQFDKTLMAVKPVSPTNVPPLLGIMSWKGDTNISLVYPTPWQQVSASATQIFDTVAALFQPKGQVTVQQLGGAVMIMRVYSTLFDDEDGWRRVLWFSVILNVNLALLNLLPLPVLDGGHITLSLIEVIRRRPVSATFLNAIQNGFAVLIIGFMLYIAFFDAGDWWRSSRADHVAPLVFQPASAAADQSHIDVSPNK